MDVQELPFQDLADPQALTLWNLYQSQVEVLVKRFPLWGAWIVYQTDHQQKKQVAAIVPQAKGQSTLKSYLESEGWLGEDWPSQALSLPLGEGSAAYVYPLSETGADAEFRCPPPREEAYTPCAKPCLTTQTGAPEYLLLWSQALLSSAQQQAIEQHVHLLRHLLSLNRHYHRQQAEIALLEQILQRVGHQLGNPLALIRLSAATLTLDLPPELYREQVTLICETADRLKTHLSDLIQCGRRSSLHLAPHNLQEILAESLQELRPWFDEKDLHYDMATAFVTVAVDRLQLKQVFDNLLSNAIAFSPPGSTITCHWQVYAHEVLVQVRDQGPGLSEEDLKQAFIPFYTRRPGGQGLGLAIAQKIILDHQGRLWAETLPTGGAQFSFTLPRPRPKP